MRTLGQAIVLFGAVCVADASAGATSIPVVAYGDSITADATVRRVSTWCGARSQPELDCEPRGVSGETTSAGIGRLLDDLEAGEIDPAVPYVVLAWGANDVRRRDWDAEVYILQPIEQAVVSLFDAGFENGP